MNQSSSIDARNSTAVARRVIATEAAGVTALADRVGAEFQHAVEHLLQTGGRAIVCGMGKSGIVGHKIAATLMSTGTPSFYLHPGEAYHGDLGMIAPGDTMIAISNSGETDEVVKLLPFLAANGNFLIAMTGNPNSTLARAAHWHLDVGVAEEACPLQLAPTASTTATLVLGDALAIALMEARGFGPEDFARFHPGGALGRRLLSRVEDEMVTGNLPIVEIDADFTTVVGSITRSKLGIALVRTPSDWAIVTDGDLRRAVERFGPEVFTHRAADMMSPSAAGVSVGTRMEDAFAKMDRMRISVLLVFDGDELAGVIKK